MANQKKTYPHINMTSTHVIFIVLSTLKLAKAIDLSWWWVTAPIWGSLLLSIFFLLLAVLCEKVIFPLWFKFKYRKFK